MIPACAPSTPASHEPSVLTTSPFSYSLVSSPRYQRFPAESCAYQSSVSSMVSPSADTRSCTTVAVIPRISFVSGRTVTTTCCSVPSASVSRYVHVLPGAIGQKGWSIAMPANCAGSSSIDSLPCGSGIAVAAGGGELAVAPATGDVEGDVDDDVVVDGDGVAPPGPHAARARHAARIAIVLIAVLRRVLRLSCLNDERPSRNVRGGRPAYSGAMLQAAFAWTSISDVPDGSTIVTFCGPISFSSWTLPPGVEAEITKLLSPS